MGVDNKMNHTVDGDVLELDPVIPLCKTGATKNGY